MRYIALRAYKQFSAEVKSLMNLLTQLTLGGHALAIALHVAASLVRAEAIVLLYRRK